MSFSHTYPAGLREPMPAGTTAGQTWTTSPRMWRWTGSVCISTACPRRWSRGLAGTELQAHWRARCEHYSAHLWITLASAASDDRVPPLPAAALRHQSASGSGKLSDGRGHERNEVWPMSSEEKTRYIHHHTVHVSLSLHLNQNITLKNPLDYIRLLWKTCHAHHFFSSMWVEICIATMVTR